MDSPNPTAATLLALAEALDLEVVARPKKSPAPKATKVAAKQRSGKARVSAWFAAGVVDDFPG